MVENKKYVKRNGNFNSKAQHIFRQGRIDMSRVPWELQSVTACLEPRVHVKEILWDEAEDTDGGQVLENFVGHVKEFRFYPCIIKNCERNHG